MNLRNFCYLDTSTLDDYLSTLEGAVIDGPVDQTEQKKSHKSGKAGYKIVEGNIGIETTQETKQKLSITDAGKFQHLFELLETQDQIKFLDVFDEDIWNEISRGDILEIQSIVRLPTWFNLVQTIDSISPFLQLMTAMGQDPLSDTNSRTAYEGISGLAKTMEKSPVPVLFKAVSTPNYEFVTNLSRQYIRCQLSELQAELTVFGKVQRIIKSGERIEAFSLLPVLSTSLPSMNISQKKQMQQDMVNKGLAEIVKGPAMVLSPVALYR